MNVYSILQVKTSILLVTHIVIGIETYMKEKEQQYLSFFFL